MFFRSLFKKQEKKSPANTTREKGFAGEDVACEYLEGEGYNVIERNYVSSKGEIDIIAVDDRHIVFVEVKTREDGLNVEKYGRPALAVTREKQKRIIFTAKCYRGVDGLIPRFDIIEIYKRTEDGNVKYRINHIERAFDLSSAGVKRY